MAQRTITVLGGTGFIGRHLTERLTAANWLVRIPTRHPEHHRDLLVGRRVELLQGNINDPDFLAASLAGADAAVNLVGILNERGHDGSGFRAAHVELPRKVVGACQAAGVPRLLHMSALNADAEKGPSHYLRTKGEGEALVHGVTGLAVTSFRPSVVFGPGDSFFNRFADLLRVMPVAFPLACPHARFAPVYVGDVAAAMVSALDTHATIGERYELCGPRSYHFIDLVQYTARIIGVKRRIIPLNDALSRLQAAVMEYAPGKPFSRDNYASCQLHSTCSGPFPEVFGITPRSVESVVPGYLGWESRRGPYGRYRRAAKRA